MRLKYCNGCAKEVEVDDFARCSECDGFVGGQAGAATPDQRDAAITAARAQINWGRRRETILQGLMDKGLSQEEAMQIWGEVSKEREGTYKAKGMGMMKKGGIGFGVCALIMFLVGTFGWESQFLRPFFLFASFGFLVSILVVAFGGVHFVTGGREGDELG